MVFRTQGLIAHTDNVPVGRNESKQLVLVAVGEQSYFCCIVTVSDVHSLEGL